MHNLNPTEAAKNDVITKAAILNNNYTKISLMNNNFLDCPPALIIFLKYTEIAKGKVNILQNTDASKLIHNFTGATTSYFVLRGIS